MGHEKGGNVLKCIAEESSWQPVVAPHAFCEEGKGCRYSSSGGPIMDMCLGAGHCGHGALGNGRMGFQLRKGASFAVRDWLRGVVVVGSLGETAPLFAHAQHSKGHKPCGPCGNKDQNFKKTRVCWEKHRYCGHPGA